MRYFIAVLFWLILFVPCWAEGEKAQVQDSEDVSSFIYDDHGRRDPFWRLVNATGMVVNYDTSLMISDLVLEGVILDNSGKSMAIVNGRIVKKGDQLGQYVISKIEKEMILLVHDQKQFELLLKKEE